MLDPQKVLSKKQLWQGAAGMPAAFRILKKYHRQRHPPGGLKGNNRFHSLTLATPRNSQKKTPVLPRVECHKAFLSVIWAAQARRSKRRLLSIYIYIYLSLNYHKNWLWFFPSSMYPCQPVSRLFSSVLLVRVLTEKREGYQSRLAFCSGLSRFCVEEAP